MKIKAIYFEDLSKETTIAGLGETQTSNGKLCYIINARNGVADIVLTVADDECSLKTVSYKNLKIVDKEYSTWLERVPVLTSQRKPKYQTADARKFLEPTKATTAKIPVKEVGAPKN